MREGRSFEVLDLDGEPARRLNVKGPRSMKGLRRIVCPSCLSEPAVDRVDLLPRIAGEADVEGLWIGDPVDVVEVRDIENHAVVVAQQRHGFCQLGAEVLHAEERVEIVGGGQHIRHREIEMVKLHRGNSPEDERQAI